MLREIRFRTPVDMPGLMDRRAVHSPLDKPCRLAHIPTGDYCYFFERWVKLSFS